MKPFLMLLLLTASVVAQDVPCFSCLLDNETPIDAPSVLDLMPTTPDPAPTLAESLDISAFPLRVGSRDYDGALIVSVGTPKRSGPLKRVLEPVKKLTKGAVTKTLDLVRPKSGPVCRK